MGGDRGGQGIATITPSSVILVVTNGAVVVLKISPSAGAASVQFQGWLLRQRKLCRGALVHVKGILGGDGACGT